jgi:hypothetical protein|tara:strand:- start:1013 stop:1312 length:300 start_codon:yes stop_codon:yes gene_type:complete
MAIQIGPRDNFGDADTMRKSSPNATAHKQFRNMKIQNTDADKNGPSHENISDYFSPTQKRLTEVLVSPDGDASLSVRESINASPRPSIRARKSLNMKKS